MKTHKVQIAVLGAGPAGAIAARQLGQAGLDVLLIDADTPFRGHITESFPASGAPLAQDIGLLDVFCACSSGPAETMQMVWRDTPEVRTFEGDGPLLLNRQLLHSELRGLAVCVSKSLKARVREVITKPRHAEVRTDAGQVECEIVLDARGRTAQKRATSDLVALPFTARGGLAAHSMCLEAFEDGWLWATAQSGDEVNGAIFQRANTLGGLGEAARQAYARSILARSEIFHATSDACVLPPGAAGLSSAESPVLSERHILIGDAGLARDPIASHGLVHAVRSAVQAAIAGRTILDPGTDSHAARTFLNLKHNEEVSAAKTATQRAYSDQSRFRSPFWSQLGQLQSDEGMLPEIGSGPVTLANPLTRAPILGQDRISWAAAIKLPATNDFLTGLGPISALEIAAACRPEASLPEIAARLGRQHDTLTVFTALERLTLGGAFVQARRSI